MNDNQGIYIKGCQAGINLSSNLLNLEYQLMQDKLKEYEKNLDIISKEALLASFNSDINQVYTRLQLRLNQILSKSEGAVYISKENLPESIKEELENIEKSKEITKELSELPKAELDVINEEVDNMEGVDNG